MVDLFAAAREVLLAAVTCRVSNSGGVAEASEEESASQMTALVAGAVGHAVGSSGSARTVHHASLQMGDLFLLAWLHATVEYRGETGNLGASARSERELTSAIAASRSSSAWPFGVAGTGANARDEHQQ